MKRVKSLLVLHFSLHKELGPWLLLCISVRQGICFERLFIIVVVVLIKQTKKLKMKKRTKGDNKSDNDDSGYGNNDNSGYR